MFVPSVTWPDWAIGVGQSAGSSWYHAKPFEVGALAELLRRSINARREAGSVEAETDALMDDFSRSGLVGRSPAMGVVYKLIAHAARSDATVLITGESGTGKELAARAVHGLSSRVNHPFVAVNCSGLTDTLLEAELFGHSRGAYTGAEKARPGYIRAADHGTLLLDEISDLPLAIQAKLLRVLEDSQVTPLGESLPVRVHIRVIAAGQKPLSELVSAGKFRGDLFARLNGLELCLPALRERREEIPFIFGAVLRVVDDNFVLVEGANRVRKHQKPNPMKGTTGGIVDKEMPIHVSNIAIFNAATGKADRVGVKTLADGKRVRVYKSSGEEIKA